VGVNGKPKKRKRKNGSTSQSTIAPTSDAERALDKRDAAYRLLLDTLPLSPDHREALRRRGLTDEEIDVARYRTLPSYRRSVVRKVADALGEDFTTVPGFIEDERTRRIAAPNGLVVPVRDTAGRVVALKIRPDKPGSGGKYRYLSSVKYGGPGPGSPAHVPVGVAAPCDVVRITEGELKADVATRLSGVPTVAFPGVGSWLSVLPMLQALVTKTVRVAFDADADKNKTVAKALLECVSALPAHGYAVELERWSIEAGKGIDDVFAAGKADAIEVLTGPAALQVAREIAKATGVDDRLAPDGPNEAVDDPHRLARLYIEQHGTRDGTQSLWFWQDEWHRWDGVAYRVVAGPEIRAGVNRLAKAEFDAENVEAVERYNAKRLAGDTDRRTDKGPPQARKVTATLETNVLHAQVGESLLPGDVEQPTWLADDVPFPADEVLATASGLLHLPSLTAEKRCLLPPTPIFFSGNALPYGFDPEANCPEWLRFLESLWPDDRQSIDVLQEWFGYCQTPDTRQHKLLLLIGPPRSGKGTIARVQRGVIGEQNLASPTLASLAGPFGLWPLLGKLVALIADARLSRRTDAIAVVERLLSISGEDPQDVARKNMPTLAGIRLPVRFVLMTNELPNMRDASGALTTRVILLRLTQSFRGREDKTLTKRLLRERAGILNWSIQGWQRLNERGYFQQPESGQELLDDLQDLASPVWAFVRDCCITGPEFSESVQDLFSCWKKWCEQHGRDHPGTEQTFGRHLGAAFPAIKVVRPRTEEGNRERIYNGIGIRQKNGI